MVLVVYALKKVLLNETPHPDEEIVSVATTALKTGVVLSIDEWKMSFHPISEAVVGVRSSLEGEEAEAILYRLLWRVRPYPEWLLRISEKIGEGRWYVSVVPGEGRFTLRKEMGGQARLVANTGSEDIYVSRFEPKIDGKYAVAYADDPREALRRAYMLLRNSDLNGRIDYDTIDSLDVDFEVPDLSSVDGLLKALEIFEEWLVDVRIPHEMCLVLRRGRS